MEIVEHCDRPTSQIVQIRSTFVSAYDNVMAELTLLFSGYVK